MENMELPNNLRINTHAGELFCADGTDLKSYLLDSTIALADNAEQPIVILKREDFIRLCRDARVNQHLIEAA